MIRILQRKTLCLLCEHLLILIRREMSVLFIKNDVLLLKTRTKLFQVIFPIVAQTQHPDWKRPIRQVKQLTVELIVFHDVSDIAGTNAQRLGSNHRILCCNHRILDCQQQVIEYLRFLYELKKVKKNPNIKQTQQEYLEQIMELVKIKEVSERVIRNLSKGYRQRVGLAQALVGDPQLLILDEPTVGLDPAQIIEIRQLIRQLAKTRTVLLSSHILSEVQAVCDRIIILHQGHIVADASQEELTGQMGGQMQLQLEVEGNSKTVLETLRKIGGIAEVYRQEEKQYLLHLEEGCKSEAVRREIFKAFSRLFERDGSCLLLSMQEKGRTLEEVFMQLTAQDALANEQEQPQTENESGEEEGKTDGSHL